MKRLHFVFLFFFAPLCLFAQKQFSGTILDSATNSPISDVVIKIQGKAKGTTSDSLGNFTISAASGDVLNVSSNGYNPSNVTLGDNSNIMILLGSSIKTTLDQVVVVGYGTQRKIDVTGSVVQLKGAELAKQGVVNPVSGLQGKVPGVNITNTGTPGSSPQINIRGVGSYSSNTAPLYVVDGVWLTDISYLNPNDIESMSILKDASSESIYGVRGANGVVLITTKKGSKRGLSVNYNGSVGVQIANHFPKMADGYQYATMINELTRLSGGTSTLDSSQFGKGTNWFDVATRKAIITSHQVSVNGGSDKSTFNLSLGYLNQDGILKTNTYKRYTVSFSNDINLTKNIKTGYNIIGTYSKSFDPPASIWRKLYTAPPIIGTKNADGSYSDPTQYGLGSAVSNPQAILDYNHSTTQNYHINGNMYLDISFLKHFKWHSSIGGIYDNTETQSFTPIYHATVNQYSEHTTLTDGKLDTKNWIVENTLTYENKWGDHRLTALLGQTAYKNNYGESYVTGNDGIITNDPATWYFTNATPGNYYNVTPTNPQTYPAQEKVSSYFGRVSYSYKNRYTFNGTLRADASSKFTANSGRAWLPSFGAAWIISNEAFMANQKVFDELKLKASWGEVGNSGVPAYVANQQGTSTGSVIYGNSGNISSSQSVASIKPDPLKWEKSIGTDIGLEAAFLQNRLTLEADYYNKKTKDMVFPVPILGTNGTASSTILTNVGDMVNKGFEVALNWKDNINSDWSYNIGVNASQNTNKFTRSRLPNGFVYGGDVSTGGQQGTLTTVGHPIGSFYGYQVIGIFQNQAEINSYTDANGNMYQPDAKPGDFKYESFTKNGAINGNDRTFIGNPNPKYYYGINLGLRFKSFDLALDFNGVADVSVYNANKGYRYGNENFTEKFYNERWHGEGTSNTNPSVNIGGNQNYYANSWYVESGAYFRLRNAQLGYTLPHELTEKWKIQNLRFYANAQNPFTITKYTGFTPEVGGLPGSMGIDNNTYPLYATYTIGVNLTF